MTNPTTDEYLVSLQRQIDKLRVKTLVNESLITEILYTAMIEEKLTIDWVRQRVVESRKILDRLPETDSHLAKIYLAERSSDLLSDVESEISDALDFLIESRKS